MKYLNLSKILEGGGGIVGKDSDGIIIDLDVKKT